MGNTGKRKKETVEFRYYELPRNAPFLARMGEEWKRVYGRNASERHFHNLLEIGVCHYGGGSLFLGERERRFEGGMVSVIPPGYLHSTVSDPGTEAYWEYLFVDVEDFLSGIYGEGGPRLPGLTERLSGSSSRLPGSSCRLPNLSEKLQREAVFVGEREQPRLMFLMNAILEELREEREYYMESVRGLLLSAFMEVVRINGGGEGDTDRKKRPRIAPALFYIGGHYAEEMKVEELAELCHLSETHFRRVFERDMNMTPVEYVNLVRVRMACELLKGTEDSMEEVAEKSGFRSLSAFNRNFRKLLGTSPYQWKLHPEKEEKGLFHYRVRAQRGW